jgi:membrane-bound inhibitor of C-type lysozyme
MRLTIALASRLAAAWGGQSRNRAGTVIRGLAVASASFALGACSPSPPPVAAIESPTVQAGATRYACDDGTFLSLAFRPEAVDVTLVDGATVALPRLPAASGRLYAAGAYALRGGGGAVTWSDGSPTTSCLATRADG